MEHALSAHLAIEQRAFANFFCDDECFFDNAARFQPTLKGRERAVREIVQPFQNARIILQPSPHAASVFDFSILRYGEFWEFGNFNNDAKVCWVERIVMVGWRGENIKIGSMNASERFATRKRVMTLETKTDGPVQIHKE